jgi:hypothetical protein
MSDSKLIQAELSSDEYYLFKELAQEREFSIAAALYEAVECWIEKQYQIDPNDPLFDILDQLDQEPLPDKPRTNATMENDPIDEWNGSTSRIKFSETIGISGSLRSSHITD